MTRLLLHKTNDKTLCCGCNACGDACAHHAISFKTDKEGFWYPSINPERCIDCGLCERACPMQNKEMPFLKQFDKPICIGAYHKSLEIRMDSTSGGIFSSLAKVIYDQGGYVSGAIYTDTFDVVNFVSNNPDDLTRLRRSKYAQSSAIGLYRQIKQLLMANKLVLVCGTPCQVAALRCFLNKDYSNLIVVDILCKSCNSPKVFHRYLSWLETQHRSKVISCQERDKEHGWNALTRRVDFKNGQTFFGKGFDDHFQRGFQYNIYERPSCYNCKFKGIPRLGDLTIGDFWGIERVDQSLYDNKGTSMIFLNNEKGQTFFETIKSSLVWKQVNFENIVTGNSLAIMGGGIKDPLGDKRNKFFKEVDEKPFDEVAKKYFPLHKTTEGNMIVRIKNKLLTYLKLH